jgi:(1->4)-alpha-D-glucan 1-alpha-D-glucosylmutase
MLAGAMNSNDTPAWDAAISREAASGDARPPASTCRLQLGPDFGFAAAAAVVPYLADLGVDALYVSPILAAGPGSTHGYDVVDFGRIAPLLGGDEGFLGLCETLARHRMRLVVDVVPNHMGIGSGNGWWTDLLENGPSSVHAAAFDVDWDPIKPELRHKVLLPVLGEQYGAVLERGELRVERDGGSFVLRYGEHRFPLAPRSVPRLIRHGLDGLVRQVGEGDPHLQELESICTALEKLAPRHEPDAAAVAERAREKEVAKRRLAALCAASAPVRAHVDRALAAFNGRPGDPRSLDLLHELLEAQAYRLACWRVAGEEINYRRFFDVNGLAAVRMEDPAVFSAAHALLLDQVALGRVHGLRVDHPDGLYDPAGYFHRLQAAALLARARARGGADGPDRPGEGDALLDRIAAGMRDGRLPARPLYLVAEKILATGERMPATWAVHGTTGYDFLNEVNGLFVDPAGGPPLEKLRRRLGARRTDFREEAVAARRMVATSLMASELHMLAHRLDRTSETNRRTRDFTHAELRQALIEYVVQLPVYRTYVTPGGEVDPRDASYVEATLARARRALPLLDPSIFDFLRDVLLLRYPETLPPRERRDWLEFALKVQQVTGPVTAKAVEDTTFYTHVRLVSLNEVGGDPATFGLAPEAFHRRCAERLATWPGSLVATSTHDTKRAEDVRTRIDALSEMAGEWEALVRTWGRLHRRFVTRVDGTAAPDRTDEHLLYQTLVGTWPDEAGPGAPGWAEYADRIGAYLVKALREAKRRTSWMRVNPAYESAVRRFLDGCLASGAFLSSMAPVAARVAAAGRLSSLAQVALRCTVPGVPDLYQGSELWDLSLVDPDNRRRVDFAARQEMLRELDRRAAGDAGARAALAREVSSPAGIRDGRAKLLLLAALLRLRRAEPDLFLDGSYEPLEAEGGHALNVVGLVRTRGDRTLACIVPRLALQLVDGAPVAWDGQVRLPGEPSRSWVDVVTGAAHPGGSLPLGRAFADFPAAVLRTGS